ncbi:MAG: PTS-dependent dihydroxyacetone kinase phosphotransferase subunit DhaM, partial [Tuberibacillus sp.]
MSVGIVLVSHSYELVEGLSKILHQVQPEVRIGVAGGTDENEIGTSALKIKQAIEEVDSGSGVAVLFDLGRAMINTEL